MADSPTYDHAAFTQFEQNGWRLAAAGYADVFEAVTAQAVPELLRAVEARRGTRLLDIACGPGTLAAAAAERGAEALGLDFIEEMVAVAEGRHTGPTFRVGNAEALGLPADTFDAAVCSFGVLHFGQPERAFAEAFRVLKPGGRYAITAWRESEESSLFTLIGGAVRTHGELTESLPEGPDFFRFGRADTARQAFTDAGFQQIETVELPLVASFTKPEAVLPAVLRGSVRTRGMIERLTPASRANVEAAVLEGARSHVTERGVELPAPVLMTVGRKP